MRCNPLIAILTEVVCSQRLRRCKHPKQLIRALPRRPLRPIVVNVRIHVRDEREIVSANRIGRLIIRHAPKNMENVAAMDGAYDGKPVEVRVHVRPCL